MVNSATQLKHRGFELLISLAIAGCTGGASSKGSQSDGVVSCDINQSGLHYCEEIHGPTATNSGCPLGVAGVTPGSGCSRSGIIGSCTMDSYSLYFYETDTYDASVLASATASICSPNSYQAYGTGGATSGTGGTTNAAGGAASAGGGIVTETGGTAAGVGQNGTGGAGDGAGGTGHDGAGGTQVDLPKGGGTGASCADATCRILATGQNLPRSIAVDSTTVYWVNEGTPANNYMDGQVMSVPITGGTPIALASNQNSPLAIAVDSNNVYWANAIAGGGAIMKMPAQGGTPVTLATAASALYFAVDSTNIYYLAFDNGSILSVPIAGGIPVVLSKIAGSPIAVDATKLYYPAKDADGTLTGVGGNHLIVSLPRAGGPVTTLTSSLVAQLGQVTSIALVGDRVYWGDCTRSTIETVSLLDGTRTVIASAQQAPFGMASDDKNLYWTATNGGAILKVTLGGGPLTKLATAQGNPWGIAVDATSVYWANNSSGEIVSTPK